MSLTPPLAIEGVKYEDGQNGPTSRLINNEGQKGVKNKETAPEAHTTALERSDCPAVDACCKYGHRSMFKTTQYEYRKADHIFVSYRCLGQCDNIAPQTQLD